MPAVRSGFCSEAEPETLLRRWPRSRDRGVAVTTSHPWMARLSLTGHPTHGRGGSSLQGTAWGISRWRQETAWAGVPRRKEAPVWPPPRNQPLPLVCWSPGAAINPPPKPSCPHPRTTLWLRASCCSSAAEETEPPKGTDNLRSVTSQG